MTSGVHRGTASVSGREASSTCTRRRRDACAAVVRRTPPSAGPRSFTGWTKQPVAEPAVVAALYAEGRTEREIAVELGVSRQRIADALAAAGVVRREPGRRCPVDSVELHRLVIDEGLNQAQLAHRFGAASGTVSRWLAECGLGMPDSRVDPAQLRELYVTQRLTTREVGAELGMSHNRVIRELELAGIPRRSRHERRPRDARAEVTKEAAEELYVRRGLTVRELAETFGVSDEYLRKRLREFGIAKRPGSFRPKLARRRSDLMADAAELYAPAGATMRDVADELGISTSIVRELLHEAGVTVRPPGRHPIGTERRVLRDLYRDPVTCCTGSLWSCRTRGDGRGQARTRRWHRGPCRPSCSRSCTCDSGSARSTSACCAGSARWRCSTGSGLWGWGCGPPDSPARGLNGATAEQQVLQYPGGAGDVERSPWARLRSRRSP